MSSNTPIPYPTSTAWADDKLQAKGPTVATSHPTHPPRSSNMLPGTEGRGAQDHDDLSYDRTSHPSKSLESRENTGTSLTTPGPLAMEPEWLDTKGCNAWAEQQPPGVRPTESSDCVRAKVPETHTSMADKLVGKMQKIIGKATGNPEMQEQGELREAGDKPMARGKGRGPHD